MIKDFFIRKLLDSQLKDVPQETKDKIVDIFLKNPEFFNQIANEVKEEVSLGKDQMSAVRFVLERHGEELKKLFPSQ